MGPKWIMANGTCTEALALATLLALLQTFRVADGYLSPTFAPSWLSGPGLVLVPIFGDVVHLLPQMSTMK